MENKNEAMALFLTGCVNPAGMAFTKLQDVNLRKEQYCEAIRFYLQKTDEKVVFVENSGTDLSEYFKEERSSGRIEIHTFSGNSFERKLGKGFGEMNIIEYGLNHSPLIGKVENIIKITGRHKVLNISSLIQQVKNTPMAFAIADLRDNLHYADSRIFAGKKEFFGGLLQYKNKLNDDIGQTFEIALSNAILQSVIAGKRFALIRSLPRISGVSGTTAISYEQSFIRWAGANLKHYFRFKSFMH